MSEMEEKLGTILNNPQMMQQIMALAQSMNQSSPAPERQEDPPKQQENTLPALPSIDPGMLQRLSGLAGQSGIDKNQQALLRALSPYLSRNRVNKLEKAMRAAKMARIASSFLNSGALQAFTGR